MKKALLGLLALVIVMVPVVALASTQSKLNQVIGAGVISTDVVDASGSPVATPSFSMTSASVSSSCQTITGTYGDNAQRVAVDNPGGANGGWVLSIAATDGTTAKWTSGSNDYAFNDASGSGCTSGQMTLDPSVATLGLNSESTNTGISKGSAASFASGSVDAITLMSASAASDDVWNGYLTGIGISQKIPAATQAGTYMIDLTQTVVAS